MLFHRASYTESIKYAHSLWVKARDDFRRITAALKKLNLGNIVNWLRDVPTASFYGQLAYGSWVSTYSM